MISKILPKSEFSKNVFTLMSGTAIAQVIPFVMSPILTRMYSPKDFGIFALFSSIVGILSVIASARYEQAIMLPKYNKYAINIFALAFFIILVTTMLSILIVYVFKDSILNLLNSSELGNWLYVVPVTVLFVASFNLLTNYNNRTKHYKDIAKATVIKSFVLSLVQVIAGFFKIGFSGLILGQLFAQLFANVTLIKNIMLEKVLLKSLSFQKMVVLSKKYNKFPKYNMLHALINNISNSLPVYIFTVYFGSVIVGYYSLVFLVVLTPLSILSLSMSRVYNQKIAEMHTRKNNIYKFTIKKIKMVTKIILLPYTLFVVYSPELFQIIFGNDWFQSGIFLQILSPYLFLNVLVSVISFIPNLLGIQKKALLISLIHMMSSICVLYYFSSIGEIYYTLAGLSILNTIFLIYNLIWFLRTLKEIN